MANFNSPGGYQDGVQKFQKNCFDLLGLGTNLVKVSSVNSELLFQLDTLPYCGRDHPWTGWKYLPYQAWWNLILPVHSPQLQVITTHNLQYTVGKVQICLPLLGPSLCTGHLPMDDGPDLHPLWWSDWHHRWCSHTWKRWQGTWQTSQQIHESHQWTWACLQQGKCTVKQTSVVFFGCVYDANGAHPDPEKVSAVHQVPAPETKAQLQKFLGLVTYQSPFIL